MEAKAEKSKKTKKLTPLKGIAEYQLVGLGINPMRTDVKVRELPFMSGVPTKDTIVEKDDDGNEITVEISYSKDITFFKSRAGAIFLNSQKAEDLKKYEYMERCNYNASNPNRDPSKPAIFERVDRAAQRKAKAEKRNELRSALEKAGKLSDIEARRIAVALNITGVDPEDIKMGVEDFAEREPVKFLAMLENKDTEIMRRAEDARKAKIITVDNQKRAIIVTGGSTLHTWPPRANADWKEEFVIFVKSEEGQAFYNEMVAQLDAKEKK